jgi:hypothetical protein
VPVITAGPGSLLPAIRIMKTDLEARRWRVSRPRLGPVLVLVGLALTLTAMINFLTTFGLFEPVRFAWCCWIGMPLFLVGIVLCDVRRLRVGQQEKIGSPR